MSAAKEAPPPPAEGAPPKRSKKLLIIILASVLLLVLVLAAGTVLLLKNKATAEGDDEATEQVEGKKDKKKAEKHVAPTYLKIEPYTINLKGEQGDQYLRLEMSAEFEDQHSADLAKSFMPKIRHQTMQLLKGKQVSELNSKEGTEKLAREIRDEINLVLGEPEEGQKVPQGPVKEVLFTDFVIQ